jgi:excisionase family DNA binding protein
MEPGYMTLPEVAKYLGTSEDTLRGWVRKKRMPYHKPGKTLLFRKADVDAWMNRYRHGAKGLELRGFNGE